MMGERQYIVDTHSADFIDTPEEATERNVQIPLSRQPDIRRLPYRERISTPLLTIHSGQRKLLIIEIEFLTKYACMGSTVVYAGAAPGRHIRCLSTLFPECTFELYDPLPFSRVLENVPRISLHREYFTDKTAEKYLDINSSVLFISDIRSGDSKEGDFDDHIASNMQAQQRWVEIIQPKRALLKFRLPFIAGSTQYLDGTLLLQPWAPEMSAELRLDTDGTKYKSYDHTEIEQRMYRHNIITRVQNFHHPVHARGIDHCYDCTTEVTILHNFLVHRGKNSSARAVSELISRLSSELLDSLLRPPHGLWPDESALERRNKCIKEFDRMRFTPKIYRYNKTDVRNI